MNTTRLVQRARGILIAAVGLILAGYASSVISTGQCEQHAANNLATELGDRNVFVLPEGIGAPFYSGALEILQRAGFAARRCVTSGRNFDCVPWAGVAAADVIGPFVVDVRWGYIAGPYGFAANELSRIESLVREHEADLLKAWHEYFRRNDRSRNS